MAHFLQKQFLFVQASFNDFVNIERKVPFLHVLLILELNEEVLDVVHQGLEFYQHCIIQISRTLYILQEKGPFG